MDNNEQNNNTNKLFDDYYNDLYSSVNYDNFYQIIKSFFICFCHECIPFINKIIDNNIILSSICDNIEQQQYSIKDTFKNFIKKINTYNKCFDQCKYHYKKFDYFCLNCKQHLCSQCCQESNEHSEHNIILFDIVTPEAEKIASNINEKIKNHNYIDEKLKELFNIIYDNFLENKRYYSYNQTFDAFIKVLDSNN